MEHRLYITGDVGAPDSIKDRNGDVVLAMCKVCGRAESELKELCIKGPGKNKEHPMVENQHQKITGYRDLTQEEIDLMNEVKAEAEECRILVEKLKRRAGNLDQRWVSIGATDLQTGFMALVRAIAQPTTF